MSNRPDATWAPLDAAAAKLGISPDAARKRLERGTLAGEKRDGRWWIHMDDPDAAAETTDRPPSGQADATWTPPDAMSDTARELIDHLKTENAFLRDQLEQTRRDQTAERERFDVIHREALQRIEALTATITEPDGDENAPDAPTASPVAPGREQPPVMSTESLHQPSWLASAWQRLLGRS